MTGQVIAIDGIAVIVNNSNEMDEMTSEQVKAIFTGETTEWEALAEELSEERKITMSHMKEKRDEAHIYDCRLYFGTGGIPICFFLFLQTDFRPSEKSAPLNSCSEKYGDLQTEFTESSPMIVASIYVTGGAILFGVPIALLTSVFMARYCPKKSTDTLKSGIELMAGVPSIVYGFFGLILLVPLIREVFGEREPVCWQRPASRHDDSSYHHRRYRIRDPKCSGELL